ncbi:MAG: GFA family protein [Pseudoruegeria sp.]
MSTDTPPITGRCYCGALSVSARALPDVVTYCHCNTCRRLSGAPVSVFAAFAEDAVAVSPVSGLSKRMFGTVERAFCTECGTQIYATYDYLPDQVYLPTGLLDQAHALPPTLHGHVASALPWLHIDDNLPQNDKSSRDHFKATKTETR